jgi:hypothetical protein
MVENRDFSSTKACNSTEKICDVVDPKFFYCVPKSENCPIRDIAILNAPLNDLINGTT